MSQPTVGKLSGQALTCDTCIVVFQRICAEAFVSQPAVGKLCCAKYSGDGQWYRAVILSCLETRKVEVRYVDYGNSDAITRTSLREPFKASRHLLSLPYQVVNFEFLFFFLILAPDLTGLVPELKKKIAYLAIAQERQRYIEKIILWPSCDKSVVSVGGNRSTRRKPLPNPKSLAPFSLAPARI